MVHKSAAASRAMLWFAAGENVIANMRSEYAGDIAQAQAVEISYDLQAGSYIAAMDNPAYRATKLAWASRLAALLDELGADSVCEAGTGEATTLCHVAAEMRRPCHVSGFDLSLSRVLFARDYLRRHQVEADLFCADIEKIPLPDAAVDVVITNHSLEPNGGNEAGLLRELHRVAARYLVLIEPDFEGGSEAQRQRMLQHDYVRAIPRHLAALPGRIMRHEPWPYDYNPLNKAALTVFEKLPSSQPRARFGFVSPITKRPLVPMGEYLYCETEGLLYPAPFGLPVLRDEVAVMCAHATNFAG